MDPQQRLLLRGALEALDDAGYAPNATETFQTNSMGVYVGVATCDYVDNLRDKIDVYYSPGKLLLTNTNIHERSIAESCAGSQVPCGLSLADASHMHSS